MSVPIISIVSKESGMGKTTVMKGLISALSARELRVGTIKMVHEMQIDHPGKDSWHFMEAGAHSVGIVGENRTAIIRHTETAESPVEIFPQLGPVDIVLIEGFKKGPYLKIEVVRECKGLDFVTPVDQLFALVTDTKSVKAPVPQYSFEEIPGLASFVEQEVLSCRNESLKGPEPFLGDLTHFDQQGNARMVDVSEKPVTSREAVARGIITVSPKTIHLIRAREIPKGDVFTVAEVAAILAVKETSRLIPLCHPLPISGVDVCFEIQEPDSIEATVRVKTTAQTGVEMEALTGVQIALLTLYDMCKAVDRGMTIEHIRLEEKSGGRSGHFLRKNLPGESPLT
ncbi:MAG TPA: cyclic pyranopterin monophosphate synthase MoaC [Spirochaetales bacterium]|nr:cyclic pyranopterin monophosphate synthase MoaC [Spirochaetales bacterium]